MGHNSRDISFQSHCPSVGVDRSGHKATPAVQLVAEIVMYDGIAVVIKVVFEAAATPAVQEGNGIIM